MRNRILSGVVFFALAASTMAAELQPLFTEAKTGDLLTWTIANAPADWLKMDVGETPKLIITGPDAMAWRRPAYIYQDAIKNPNHDALNAYQVDGERQLRVRHSSRFAGVHRWRLIDPAGAESAKGEFTVGASGRPLGPLRISEDNARMLAFADGSIFIPIGANIAWANGPDKLEQFERFFAALHASGGNHARVWCSSWCGQIEGDELDHYRLDHAWLLDKILALARKNDLRLTVVLDNHHDFTEGICNPYGKNKSERIDNFMTSPPHPAYVRRLKYLLARFGADDSILAWELFNEVDLACEDRDTVLSWVRAAASLLGEIDQDRRLRTVSWSKGDWTKLGGIDDLDLLQIHSYVVEWDDVGDDKKAATRDGIDMLVNAAEKSYPFNKPFFFGEGGYKEDKNHDTPGNELDLDGLLLRQQAWAGFMLGGCASSMAWWWDSYIHPYGLWQQYFGMSEIVKRVNWRDAGMAPLTPNKGSVMCVLGWQSSKEALIWAHLRQDTWHSFLIERKSRPRLLEPIPVTFSGFRRDTAFTVRGYDMISAQEVSQLHMQSNGEGELEIPIPVDCNDLVLHVRLKESK
jgi:hypothetical protein